MTSRLPLALLALALAAPVPALERVAVISLADPPGPDADLAELTHQLRAACRDRVGNVEDVPAMRARLLGDAGPASLAELDRAYGGALATYQNGEFESAVRTLRAIVEDLEKLPEGPEAYTQWIRANLRLAHAAASVGQDAVVEEALDKLARTEPALEPEVDQYSPAYRRRFDAMKKKVRALPRRRLLVEARGGPGTLYVNGRRLGTVGPAPLEVELPAGTYRIGGAAGALRVPGFTVDLTEDRTAFLDFALAEAVRPNAGPGLALAPADRAAGVIRAGAWLGVDKLVTVTRLQESGVSFLLGAIHDVRRGSLLREGQVRMVAGGVPSVSLGALAAFLLTGQQTRGVEAKEPDRTPAPPPPPVAKVTPAPAPVAAAPATSTPAPASTAVPLPPPPAAKPTTPAKPSATSVAAAPVTTAAPKPSTTPPPAPSLATPAPRPADLPRGVIPTGDERPSPWRRPSVVATGAGAVLLAGLSVQQALSSASAREDANAMVGAGGALLPGSDPARYRDLLDKADGRSRNAWIAAGLSGVLAGTAAYLGMRSPDPAEPLAFRF